jgi:hypothetical protein
MAASADHDKYVQSMKRCIQRWELYNETMKDISRLKRNAEKQLFLDLEVALNIYFDNDENGVGQCWKDELKHLKKNKAPAHIIQQFADLFFVQMFDIRLTGDSHSIRPPNAPAELSEDREKEEHIKRMMQIQEDDTVDKLAASTKTTTL